jgi:uroporphyrinogen III methyltransferase/synthase
LDSTAQPLKGKRVVVTRAPEQSFELVAALERLGADVLLLPTVTFAPPEDLSGLDAAIARLADFDWILFTSQNAVGFFAQRRREIMPADESIELEKPKVGAVGPITADAATKKGFYVDYVATNHTGEALARELAASMNGLKILLPRSDRADDRLPVALREAGAEVTAVVTYRTAAPKKIDPQTLACVQRGEVDAILFASPSAFRNLCDWIPVAELAKVSSRVQFAAIGPTTARALRGAGVQVAIESVDASPAALAGAIANYYQRQPSIARRA